MNIAVDSSVELFLNSSVYETVDVSRLYRENAAQMHELCAYTPHLPSLYPGYVKPGETLDPNAYHASAMQLSAAVETLGVQQESLLTHARLTPDEHRIVELDAQTLLSGSDVTRAFWTLYSKRFPRLRSNQLEGVILPAQKQAVATLSLVLTQTTQETRIVAYKQFEQRRDEIFEEVLGEHWRNFLEPQSIVPPNLLEDLRQRIHAELFCRLPIPDYVRMPPSQRMEIGKRFAAEVYEFAKILLNRASPYLSRPEQWPYGAQGLAPAILKGPVAGLMEMLAAAPDVRGREIIKKYINEGPAAAAQFAQARQQFYEASSERRRLETEQQVAHKKSMRAVKAAEAPERQNVARTSGAATVQSDPYRQSYATLLVDPSIRIKLAELEPGSVVRIGEPDKVLLQPDMERLVENHMQLAALALRQRVLASSESPPPILFDRQFNHDVAKVVAALTEVSYYSKRRNLWFGVLPVDEAHLSAHYGTRKWDNVDCVRHIVRLCVGVDLCSSGKAPITNMIDSLMYLRQIPRWGRLVLALASREPSNGDGAEYLQLGAEAAGLHELQDHLATIASGDFTGRVAAGAQELRFQIKGGTLPVRNSDDDDE